MHVPLVTSGFVYAVYSMHPCSVAVSLLFLVPYFPYCKSNGFMFVIYIEPYTTGSCPESTDLLPAVTALSVVLVIVVVLAVAILTIILLYTSGSDVKVIPPFHMDTTKVG